MAVPGLAMYILIGRTKDYAWSLTSAGHDVRDVYAESSVSRPAPSRRALPHCLYKGKCALARSDFDAGLLAGRPLQYKTRCTGP